MGSFKKVLFIFPFCSTTYLENAQNSLFYWYWIFYWVYYIDTESFLDDIMNINTGSKP